MKMRKSVYPLSITLLILVAAACLLASGCRRPPAAPMEASLSLGVAGFAQPASDNEALANYIPAGGQPVPSRVLAQLDATLAKELAQGSRRSYLGPDKARSCMPGGIDIPASSLHGALDFWIGVGQCMQVDFLLVPQLLFFREREGSSAGTTAPASVMLDMFVLNVKEHSVAARYRFDETQVSLSENMLTLPKFFARSGKWVTAAELAEWGIGEGVRTLGLK